VKSRIAYTKPSVTEFEVLSLCFPANSTLYSAGAEAQ
ncbi:Mycobacterium numidiamassiliense ORFan, partial [Mycobacterium numidiamassiliense]